MQPDLASLSAKLQMEREAITGMVHGLSAEQLDKPGPDGSWSVRQMLAHLVSSEGGLLSLARHIAAGENPQVPPGYDLNTANEAQVAKRQNLPLDDLLKEWETRRASWAAFLEPLTEAQAELAGEHPWFHQSVTLRQLVIIMLKHERGHKQEIAALAANG
jgi:uncharacterized damage-inducible protein DinB